MLSSNLQVYHAPCVLRTDNRSHTRASHPFVVHSILLYLFDVPLVLRTKLKDATNFQEWNNIGQSDAQTNLNIAKDNYQIAQSTGADSKQMKSIAVLTMIFLPATFVAVS